MCKLGLRQTFLLITNSGLFLHQPLLASCNIHDNVSIYNKKRSYRKESVHLTSLYWTVQIVFQYVEPFGCISQCDSRTDGWTLDR